MKNEKVELVDPIREPPWGEKGFRFYDPDYHIIEVSEPMFSAVVRMYQNGMSIEEIGTKSMIPEEFIEMVIQRNKKT